MHWGHGYLTFLTESQMEFRARNFNVLSRKVAKSGLSMFCRKQVSDVVLRLLLKQS